MLKGTNQELGRPFNKRIVLELIRRRGPLARNEIATRIGLTVQTVSTIVRELEEEGYLLSERERPRGRGVPPTKLAINPQGGFALGIHVTPLNITAALVDLCGDIVASAQRHAEQATPDEAFAIIEELAAELAGKVSSERMLGVGMAMPGPFGVESMSFVGSTTMTGWHGTEIARRLEDATGLPAFIEIDMAAAACGEQIQGRGTELDDFYYLFFGIGLGGTMMHGGSAVRGHWGNAGEVGHITAVTDGEPCPCGNRGCLERYVSLDALQRSGLPEEAWVDTIFPLFCQAIRSIENLFDPETIVVGGFTPDALKRRIEDAAGDFGNSISARRGRAVSRLIIGASGGKSVLRGAAVLAVRGALSPSEGQMFTRDLSRNREIVA